MSTPSSPFKIFGIRHHGPGCARTLVHALQAMQPDCVLVEGPPEGDEMLPFIVHEQMQPPVALLVHAADDPATSCFYPFAEFSPEWQALRWAVERGIPRRFMDLPVAVSLALRKQPVAAPPLVAQCDASSAAAEQQQDSAAFGDGAPLHDDPVTLLARIAGYPDGESWWNHLVEERGEGLELFDAIAEAMRELRQDMPEGVGRDEAYLLRERMREAHMRQAMRQAAKEGFQRIAVICGAWHVPALEANVTAKHDAAVLKGAPKIKSVATWVPWTNAHLASASGYGAGIAAPGWYEFLWKHDASEISRSVGWLGRVARLLRGKKLDCSPAHQIDAARMADALAALRGRAQPGLEELDEAIVGTICMGGTAQLDLIRAELTVGDRIGHVPETVPMVPLQQDIEREQRSVRLKPQAFSETITLDLRTDNGLARSRLLHRMRLLGVPWGRQQGAGNTKGTFKEVWELQWQPEFSVAVIEAAHWGVTLAEACGAKLVHECAEAQELQVLAAAVNDLLLADLRHIVDRVATMLEERAALTGDVGQLLATIRPLAEVHRYGSVREFDTAMVARVLDGVIVRATVGLPQACSGIALDVAQELRTQLLLAHESVAQRGHGELSSGWSIALGVVARASASASLLRGLACRLLLDEHTMEQEEVGQQLSLNLSTAVDGLEAAQWLDGFLNRNAMVLLNDKVVWGLVNEWVASLPAEHFTAVLPLVRRTFADFHGGERREIGRLAANGAQSVFQGTGTVQWNETRAALALPVLQQIFGVSA